MRAPGVGAHGSLVGYGANRRRSLSEIAMPALTRSSQALRGYGGRDEFAVVGSTLVRRFPVYRAGDALAAPGGGMRQLQYRLARGEASWQLRLGRVVSYGVRSAW